MKHGFKALLAAASALLLVGGGCAVQPEADLTGGVQVETETGAMVKEDEKMVKPRSDVDAAVDVYLDASAEEQSALSAEEGDASAVTSADAEVEAYGKVYDKSEF
jgi:hypothetical protein